MVLQNSLLNKVFLRQNKYFKTHYFVQEKQEHFQSLIGAEQNLSSVSPVITIAAVSSLIIGGSTPEFPFLNLYLLPEHHSFNCSALKVEIRKNILKFSILNYFIVCSTSNANYFKKSGVSFRCLCAILFPKYILPVKSMGTCVSCTLHNSKLSVNLFAPNENDIKS